MTMTNHENTRQLRASPKRQIISDEAHQRLKMKLLPKRQAPKTHKQSIAIRNNPTFSLCF